MDGCLAIIQPSTHPILLLKLKELLSDGTLGKAHLVYCNQVGRAGIEIAEAAYRSAKSGQPVALPLYAP